MLKKKTLDPNYELKDTHNLIGKTFYYRKTFNTFNSLVDKTIKYTIFEVNGYYLHVKDNAVPQHIIWILLSDFKDKLATGDIVIEGFYHKDYVD
jgi:hypothetical protein